MPRLVHHLPTYCHHRGSGQAYVNLDGRAIYLGKWNSRASKTEFDRLISEWTAAGRKLPVDVQAITVAEVTAAFRRHAKLYYRDHDGRVGKAAGNIDEALRPVLALYSSLPAVEFGPLRLKAVRQRMIDAGRVRCNINRLVSLIKHVFKWGAENELIPASVFHGLAAVPGLQAGRSGAKESEPVKPVPVQHVEAVLPRVSPQVAAMLRLQMLTGMRPGEVTIMRGSDIDATGKLWAYRPSRHKSKHRGHDRVIYLGPKAQDIVRPFLKTDLSAFLFSPADAEVHRRAILREQRKTPMNEGNKPGTNRQKHPQRTVGNVYTVGAYLTAVYRGCDKAFPGPADIAEDLEKLATWKREHRWHPHQIRHSAASEFRKQYGLESAQVLLGHRRLEATQIYAERNVAAAQRIMEVVG